MLTKCTLPFVIDAVWWVVRATLQRDPTSIIDQRFIANHFNMDAAATFKQFQEFRRLGILCSEGQPTVLGLRWSKDATYAEAAGEMLRSVYPAEMIELHRSGTTDTKSITRWLMQQGLGFVAAENRAKAFLLIQSPLKATV